ncbi:MAG: AAA family ATPase [Planctomycetota bacterium]|nr:AAA family ATPase [Planctomycetota bacterium]MDA1140550.1 AAA family ATPase [Planctomycetota bacterium]
MSSLQSIRLKNAGELPEHYPFSIPIVRDMGEIHFPSPVTFFVGENGSGKSTLLEGIAAAVNATCAGSEIIDTDPTLEHARQLAAQLRLSKKGSGMRGFYFRAEDFFGFTKRVARDQEDLSEMEEQFSTELTGYGRQLATGMARGQRTALESSYGQDPDAKSHGESFLEFFKQRMVPGGLYLMDEPETPLSPLRILTLISMMKEMVEQNCQFIIATHSPILMAFPNARILNFDSIPVSEIPYDDVEHVSLTRSFLNNPEAYLRRL